MPIVWDYKCVGDFLSFFLSFFFSFMCIAFPKNLAQEQDIWLRNPCYVLKWLLVATKTICLSFKLTHSNRFLNQLVQENIFVKALTDKVFD